MLVYAVILLVLAIAALIYVHSLLVRYEASQPENVAMRYLETLTEAASEGRLSEHMTLYRRDDSFDTYASALVSGGYTECVKKAGIFDQTAAVYTVKIAGEDILEIHLSAGETTTELAIFSFTEWSVSAVTPPTVRYRITVPNGFTMSVDGSVLEPDSKGESSSIYVIDYDGRDYVFTDVSGASVPYVPGQIPQAEHLEITVPESFKLRVGDNMLNIQPSSKESTRSEEILADYGVTVPALVTYQLDLLGADGVYVTDNLGNETLHATGDGKVSITSQSGADQLDGVLSEEEILQAARTWSKLMTDDIGGVKHGFAEMAKYLIEGTYLYNAAYEWATGVDITFTSIHKLAQPPFSNESVTNYISYGENCFSCDVYLEKNMIVIGSEHTDVMHSTLYWIKTEDGWRIAELLDIN